MGTTGVKFAYSGASAGVYKMIDLSEFCNQKEVSLAMTGKSASLQSGVIMNKSFRQIKPQEICMFSLGGCQNANFTGRIQFNICINDSCPREYGAWVIDARSQTVSPVTCRFYKEGDSNKCDVWDVEK
ncbi:MAG: hypothetical protein LBU27_02535 [Candidatus Peribacteria bacterium]|nr:hypothetical protein [Candidatus Peribacteria bacterium]